MVEVSCFSTTTADAINTAELPVIRGKKTKTKTILALASFALEVIRNRIGLVWFILRSCQHDDGYINGRSHHERTLRHRFTVLGHPRNTL